MNQNKFSYTDEHRFFSDERRCKITRVLHCDKPSIQDMAIPPVGRVLVQPLIALEAHGVDRICRSIPYPVKAKTSVFIRGTAVSICGEKCLFSGA